MLTASRRWECGGKSPRLSWSSVWCCNIYFIRRMIIDAPLCRISASWHLNVDSLHWWDAGCWLLLEVPANSVETLRVFSFFFFSEAGLRKIYRRVTSLQQKPVCSPFPFTALGEKSPGRIGEVYKFSGQNSALNEPLWMLIWKWFTAKSNFEKEMNRL